MINTSKRIIEMKTINFIETPKATPLLITHLSNSKRCLEIYILNIEKKKEIAKSIILS